MNFQKLKWSVHRYLKKYRFFTRNDSLDKKSEVIFGKNDQSYIYDYI